MSKTANKSLLTKEQTLTSHNNHHDPIIHNNNNNNNKGTRTKSIDVTSTRFSVLTAGGGGGGGGAFVGGFGNGSSSGGFLGYKSSSVASQYSAGLAQKLKDSGRATLILILISACFVLLNLPYVITWASFYMPFKKDKLGNGVAIYQRYAWVTLGEIFHLANFSINLFLYCLASKMFRKALISRLSFFKNWRFTIRFKAPSNA